MAVIDEFAVLVSTFIASFIIVYALRSFKKKSDGRRYPPSLPTLPLVGSLPFVRDFRRLPIFLMKKSQELGPIFTVKIFNRFTLILNSREAIVDALIRHSNSFSGREGMYTDKHYVNKNMKGLLSIQMDANFKKYTSPTLSILKEFGFGVNNLMEERILIEVEQLIEYIKHTNGKPFDPRERAILTASNIIKSILFGKRCKYEDGIDEITECVDGWISNVDLTLDVLPILRFFPYHKKKLQLLSEYHKRLFVALENEIKVISNGGNDDCFVQRFLEKEGPDHDHEQLLFTLRDLMVGGTDTTSNSLRFLLAIVANNINIQKRLFEEIDSVVPKGKFPSLADKARMPFVEATMMELLRYETTAPLAIPHVALTDTEVDKYFVAKGTVVLVNIYAANMNPEVWGDPNVFRPERFLDKDNNFVGKERLIPFSVGRRSCTGEFLARAELFLVIACLLQQFRIDPPEGQKSVEYQSIFKQVTTPSPFTVRLTLRDK